ncbi:MAG: hypothetical protein ACRD63_13725 [Pyrinomonadaceae bacterium]
MFRTKMLNYIAQFARHKQLLWTLFLLMVLVPVLILIARSLISNSVVETVTIDSNRHSLSSEKNSIALTPQLPSRDSDIEATGDRLAEARLHLKKHHSAEALKALRDAKSHTRRAIERSKNLNNNDRSAGNDLLYALGEIEAIETDIKRGQTDDARKRLASLDTKVDSINY